jgi:hypothetical protein
VSKNARAGRFDYLPKAKGTEQSPVKPEAISGELRSVPRGDGRMEQERDQLNVRIPTTLKRRAVAKAALSGTTIGELVEALLYAYVNAESEK